MSSAAGGMETCMLIRDEALLTCHTLKESELPNQFYLQPGGDGMHRQHSGVPHTFFPFSLRDVGTVESMLMARNAASACGNITQGSMETMKRPLFWPFLDTERVKRSLSPDCNVVNEQSGSTSEFCNVSHTAMMERMLSGEELDMNFDEGDSRIRKKKRLTAEQVHGLESSFDADKKLDAERKQELARRLGLEPRQIAVWFQNRRARCKTKDLEHEYTLLKSKYHSMLAETHKLRSEVSRLTAELEATKGAKGAGRGMTKSGVSCETQIAVPNTALQNPGSSIRYSTRNENKSNNVNVEPAHMIIHERSAEGDIVVKSSNSTKQNASALPSRSCSQEGSTHNKSVEGVHTMSAACVGAEENQHYIIDHAPSEIVACLASTTPRLENVDANYSSLAAYLRKVNAAFADYHKLHVSDDCLQPLNLWELTA